MKWALGWYLGSWLALPAVAQPQPVASAGGHGLKADYYQGVNFEHFVRSRRDALIDFDWHHESPVVGVPAEGFSVRWTGWLLAPATGRYVLHLTVDDGARVWLDGRQLLSDWRGQSLSFYQFEVTLRAGQAYPLRVDYCQYSADSRVLLAWEVPDAPPPPRTWHNLWGVAGDPLPTAPIPSRYLFSEKPAGPPPMTAKLPNVVVTARPTPPPAPRPAGPSVAALIAPPPPAATGPAARRSALAFVRRVPPAPAPIPVPSAPAPNPLPTPARPPDMGVRAAASRLAEGQAVTLRALYFAQGKAYLLPTVQATLDTLAQALARRPALRLEVQGHTDNQGDPAINQRLSQQRAEAVCQYLAAHGVAADRLRAVGYGGTQPVADNDQPAQRPRNRRVVLLPLPN